MWKVFGGILFVVALAAAILALRSDVAYVQPMNDHYKCYNVDGPPLPGPINVTLVDQFGTLQGVVEQVAKFSPPVDKTLPGGGNSPIIHPENHLNWYSIEGVTEQRTLLVSNQFGNDQEWVVKDPKYLLLPAWKRFVNGTPTPHDHPSGLDHYVCYEALSGPPVALDGVTLQDQFGQQVVTVGDPMLICNPADKVVPDDGLPIYNNDNHLACYDIVPHMPLTPTRVVVTKDQFGDPEFMILENQYLCAPSTKVIKPGGSCTP